MDEQRRILEALIVKKLGLGSRAEAKALTKDLMIQSFTPYLLKGSEGCTVLRSDYQPRILNTYSGEHYYRPDGWVQFRWPSNFTRKAQLKKSVAGNTTCSRKREFGEEWHVAYHGTSVEKLPSILNEGLRNPSRAASVSVEHGQAGARKSGAIYVTPSLWLAAHPVYASLYQLSPGHWVQFIVKVRVRPGSFEKQGNTLGLGHYSKDIMYDPNFEDEPQEWLLRKTADLRIVGLMMREFGKSANVDLYGELVQNIVSKRGEGVEYQWTELLCQALRAGSFLRMSGTISTAVSSVQLASMFPMVTTWNRELLEHRFDEIMQDMRNIDFAKKPLYNIISPSFDLGSIGKAWWSISLHGKTDEVPVNPSMELHLPPHSQVALLVRLGEVWINWDYDEGANKDCKFSESDDDELCFTFYMKLEYFRSHFLPNISLGVAERFEVAGSIEISDGRIEWSLLIGDKFFGRSVHSAAFPIGDAPKARLELYPKGLTLGASDCALYLWPGGVKVACRLTIASTSRILDNRLDADATDANAHWGFDSFCPIRCLKGWCKIIVEGESGPICHPRKRFKGNAAHLGA